MIGPYFNWNGTRNIIIAFGSILNNVKIQTQKDGVQRDYKVPLAYAPTKSYIAYLNSPDVEEKTNQMLPRMSFFVTDYTYAANREVNRKLRRSVTKPSKEVITQYVGTPYNFDIELNIWTKYVTQTHQIIEQILPHFRPDFNVVIKSSHPDLEIRDDIAIVYQGIQKDDIRDRSLLDDETIRTTLTFEARGKLYPASENGNIIRKAIVNLSSTLDEVDKYPIEREIATLDPFDAAFEEAWSIVETTEYIEAV